MLINTVNQFFNGSRKKAALASITSFLVVPGIISKCSERSFHTGEPYIEISATFPRNKLTKMILCGEVPSSDKMKIRKISFARNNLLLVFCF